MQNCARRSPSGVTTGVVNLEAALDHQHPAGKRWSDAGLSALNPVSGDPFFHDHMTLADVYRYPAQHFAFHQRTLNP
jgi:hypothetical protein